MFYRINKGKFFIQKIFGAKFHRKFPKISAPCESSTCGCGTYKNKDNGRMGLDLQIDPDAKSKFVSKIFENNEEEYHMILLTKTFK